MKVIILGSTGYTGQVLLRILAAHPDVQHIIPVSSSQAGASLSESDPGLDPSLAQKMPGGELRLYSLDEAVKQGADVVFAALPHLKSAEVCDPFFGKSVVIDLSADFRIKDHAIFTKAYGVAPPRPELLDRAVFGLAEWAADEIKTADLIANPGCYPTASLLGMLPLLQAKLTEGDIIINALSGISGAGRKAAEAYLYCTRTENLNAYSPGKTHRHCAEIQQGVNLLGRAHNEVFFTPHLVPVKQGMEVTTTVRLKAGTTDEAIAGAFAAAYNDRPCVRMVKGLPQSAAVRGTNRCDLAWHREDSRLFAFSVIDNLYKGASGQAVQNMNIRFGLSETRGLNLHGEIL